MASSTRAKFSSSKVCSSSFKRVSPEPLNKSAATCTNSRSPWDQGPAASNRVGNSMVRRSKSTHWRTSLRRKTRPSRTCRAAAHSGSAATHAGISSKTFHLPPRSLTSAGRVVHAGERPARKLGAPLRLSRKECASLLPWRNARLQPLLTPWTYQEGFAPVRAGAAISALLFGCPYGQALSLRGVLVQVGSSTALLTLPVVLLQGYGIASTNRVDTFTYGRPVLSAHRLVVILRGCVVTVAAVRVKANASCLPGLYELAQGFGAYAPVAADLNAFQSAGSQPSLHRFRFHL